MRLAVLASLAGHAAAIAALTTLDWRAPEFPPSIPVAVLVPPVLADQVTSPIRSTVTDAGPPPAAPAAAAGQPGIDLTAALTEPVVPTRPMAVPAAARKAVGRAAKPAPATSASAPSEAVGDAPGAAEAPTPALTGSEHASASPATAPIVEHGPAPLAGNPRPDYPPAARRRSIEGRAVIRAVVAADGRVASVELRASSAHELLDRAALEAVQRWRFTPAKRGEQAVDGAVDVPVVFRLED